VAGSINLKKWVKECFVSLEDSEYSKWFNIEELKKELERYLEGNIQSGFHIWQCISLYEMIQIIND
jgi:asparagine synthase (glutamine-hydrolysing)